MIYKLKIAEIKRLAIISYFAYQIGYIQVCELFNHFF